MLSIGAYLIDKRTLFGENVWVKPIRFSSSLAMHYATFAIVMSWLAPAWQTSMTMLVMAFIAVGSLVFQVGFIGIQAARGEPSHFNRKTELMRKLEITMAIMASLVTGPMAVLGAIVLLDTGFRLSGAVQYATGLGLIVGTIMTFIAAYHLGARENPFFGDKPENERRMVGLDWSLDRGDLRPAHFFATHMMQVTPIAGLVAATVFTDPVAITLALAVTIIWGGLAVESYRLAINAKPISRIWGLGAMFPSIEKIA